MQLGRALMHPRLFQLHTGVACTRYSHKQLPMVMTTSENHASKVNKGARDFTYNYVHGVDGINIMSIVVLVYRFL